MPEDVFGIVGNVVAGAFKVERAVAEGGFGVVYRAYHNGFRAPVALKCLKVPERLVARQQRAFLDQFRAEAEIVFRLSASIPNVVRPLHVDAFVTDAGRFVPFLALEWLDGTTLDVLADQRFGDARPLERLDGVTRLLTPVAAALGRAHDFVGPDGAVCIVHRDLKPENIFIARVAGEEIVKILDFGIAKAKSAATAATGHLQAAGPDVGSFTPAYGAPEQWLPKRFGQAGPWTDVWGLALSVVEAVVGTPVIDGDRNAMMAAALDEARRPTPRSAGVELGDAVEAVFVRALAVQPKDRYQTVALFWDELTRVVAALMQSRGGVRARVAGDELLSFAAIPDLDLGPASSGRIRAAERVLREPTVEPVRHSEAPSSSVPLRKDRERELDLDLEFDLAPAGMALELDPAELADAHRRSGRSYPSLPAVQVPPLAASETRLSAASSASAEGELEYGLIALEPPPSPEPKKIETPKPDPGAQIRSLLDAANIPLDANSWAVFDAPRMGGVPDPKALPPAILPSAVTPVATPRALDSGMRRAAPAIASEAPSPRASPPPVATPLPVASPLPVVPAPAAPQGLPAQQRARELVTAHGRFVARFGPSAGLVSASIVLTILDQAYAAQTGRLFALGPVRLGAISALLFIAGLALLGYRVLRHDTR